ncbi:MAG: hypothetical protein Q8O20_00360 [Sulfuricurvum sp.]|nr:hypothetical protein [Sulfuricurvum sp.]MDP2849503.1 hypothetical protein [Sulfuricurvum sp.]
MRFDAPTEQREEDLEKLVGGVAFVFEVKKTTVALYMTYYLLS